VMKKKHVTILATYTTKQS